MILPGINTEEPMRLTLDPKLLDLVEYDIWFCSEDKDWVCVAGRLPLLGEVSGHGQDPETALKACRSALQAAFESFNR